MSRRNKGNKGNHVTFTLRSPFCYFCPFCGTLLSHAGSFYCPAVIGFAASLVEEIKEIAEIIVTDPREVHSALSAGLLLSHADSFYCPAEIKEIKEIMLPSLCAALSALSALSVGLLVSHADSVLLFRRNKGNKGNSLTRPMRSPFCILC